MTAHAAGPIVTRHRAYALTCACGVRFRGSSRGRVQRLWAEHVREAGE